PRPAVVAAGPDRRSFVRARRPGGNGRVGQPLRDRPEVHLGGRPRPDGAPESQHAVRRTPPDRARAPHGVPRRAGGHRRGGTAVSEALLVLADGAAFEGEAIGAAAPNGVATGELVFNTVMSGYQEVITDPSYAG